LLQVSQTTGPEATLLASLASELPKRNTEDGPPALVFHGIRGENYQEGESPSWYNPQEIVQTIYYLNMLYGMGLTSSDVGIIAPYQKQVSLCLSNQHRKQEALKAVP
jgi:alpha-amylase/alpha-mannosidase (GH57 family)